MMESTSTSAESGAIKFNRSANDVILSEGSERDANIPSKYFTRVIDRMNGVDILPAWRALNPDTVS